MADDPSNIGLQHPAFAVSRTVLLNWINEFYEMNYTKVEQCATGAIFCQILDSIYPKNVAMSKVNWAAKNEYEFLNNWKFVQNLFAKKKISKPIYIDKLCKGKYQDNLEFLQWFKHFFDCKYTGQEYNAKDRRARSKTASAAGGGRSKKTRTKTASTKKPTSSTRLTSSRSTGAPKKKSPALAKANEEIAQLKVTMEGLEKERNFYFGKLREIEVLCQSEEPADKEAILKILYATDEEEGFQAPPEEEEEEEEEEEAGDDVTF